jgi:hypothetical protein
LGAGFLGRLIDSIQQFIDNCLKKVESNGL